MSHSTLLAAPKPSASDKPMSPAREFVFAMHDVARLLRTLADQRARALNMTRAQWSVLKRLEMNEGVKQAELAEQLDLQPITLARLVDKLAKLGLVERRDDPNDRRANRLYLTETAAPVLKRLNALGETLVGQALEGFDAFEIAALGQSMGRIKSNLKRELSKG
ncbi:MAG TPA: MarR family transcriptional regulator [Roseiarcus sp.]|jgi:MarR family transcriptional regulator for hemolysin|nr:MarR family transcriptional regulator [Roseiarcus sp.]